MGKGVRRKINVGQMVVVVGPHLAKAKNKGGPSEIAGPVGHGYGRMTPTDSELQWCRWGWLLAAAWFGNGEMDPPSPEYIEAFAEVFGLQVPRLSEFAVSQWEGA